MSDNDQLAICSRCGGRAEPFGAMRHRFVDVELRPICIACAHRLIPEQVAQAEEMDRQWGAEDTTKD